MTDEFAKTLVIDDPNYAPGAIAPADKKDSVERDLSTDQAARVQATSELDDDDDDNLPSFEDTSWLT